MAEHFTSTETWLGTKSSGATFADISLAQGRSLHHLLTRFTLCRHKLEGFFNVPVSSRILESALMLHFTGLIP